MSENRVIEPDLGFIEKVKSLGGDSLKKCFQCATCSVACPISPEKNPFPRKEMIAASWGLKERLVKNPDIWLCHQCGDCSTLCPRGAKPGDVLSAVRSYVVTEYGAPKFLGEMVNNPAKLPLLILIPAVIFILIGMVTGWFSFSPDMNDIVHSKMFDTYLVQVIFTPLFLFTVITFGMSLKKFVNDIHETAMAEGRVQEEKLDTGGILQGLFKVVPTILKHKQFAECSENKDRELAHLLVFYSFVGLFIVTGIFFVALDIMHIPGPYSQMNPVKWLANISGVALIVGSIMMIRNRMGKTDQETSYKDWYILILVLGLGVTGMGAEITRLAGLACVSYITYFIHLILVFNLFLFLPFSKMAHIAYRTAAMAYAEWAGIK